jgi:hypothetical protein
MASKPYIIGEYNALEYKVLIYSDKFPNGEEVYSAGNSPFDSQGYVDADKGVGLERMKQSAWEASPGLLWDVGASVFASAVRDALGEDQS